MATGGQMVFSPDIHGHILYLRVMKTEENTYQVTAFNAYDGVRYNGSRIRISKCQTHKTVCVPNIDGLNRLLKCFKSSQQFYALFKKLGTTEPLSEEQRPFYAHARQKYPNCGYKSFKAMMRCVFLETRCNEEGVANYKLFIRNLEQYIERKALEDFSRSPLPNEAVGAGAGSA